MEQLSKPEVPTDLNDQTWGEAGFNWPLRVDLNRLEADFQAFAIQNHRPIRSSTSLDLERRRVVPLCEDFEIQYRPPHRKTGTQSAAGQEEDEEPEESDDDGGDEASLNEEDEG